MYIAIAAFKVRWQSKRSDKYPSVMLNPSLPHIYSHRPVLKHDIIPMFPVHPNGTEEHAFLLSGIISHLYILK